MTKVKVRVPFSNLGTCFYYGKEYEIEEVQALKFEAVGYVEILEKKEVKVRKVIKGRKSD